VTVRGITPNGLLIRMDTGVVLQIYQLMLWGKNGFGVARSDIARWKEILCAFERLRVIKFVEANAARDRGDGR